LEVKSKVVTMIPEGDGLGDRLPDGEFGKDVFRRAGQWLLLAGGLRGGSPLGGLSCQRLDAAAQVGQSAFRQISRRQHGDPANQEAGDQGRLQQGGARQHG
jgi:hypothetical protein